ncbi:hypothetical protein D3C71_1955440 [compost metagenome]
MAGNGCEAWDQVEGLGKQPGLPRGVCTAVIRQMFDCVRGAVCVEALSDGLQHHVSNVGAGYPDIGDGRP